MNLIEIIVHVTCDPQGFCFLYYEIIGEAAEQLPLYIYCHLAYFTDILDVNSIVTRVEKKNHIEIYLKLF